MGAERLTQEGRAGAHSQQTHQRWEIDGDRSPLEFMLRHLVISEINGRFHKWGGTLVIDHEQPNLSHLTAWVDLASIDTGDAERDAHVRSSEFLDITRFPRALFTSTGMRPSDAGILVNGRLDLHGLVHDIEIQVTPWVTSHATEDLARTRYDATTTIDRQSFGLHWNQDLDVGGVVVGDKIVLRARVELAAAPESGSRATH